MTRLRIERRADGYWITGLPDGFLDCGPYESERLAAEGRRGVEFFCRDEWPTDRRPAPAVTVATTVVENGPRVQKELFG